MHIIVRLWSDVTTRSVDITFLSGKKHAGGTKIVYDMSDSEWLRTIFVLVYI